ncbi:MAG: hypothetical protein AB7O97_15095 [Planctomycetota bacterium]
MPQSPPVPPQPLIPRGAAIRLGLAATLVAALLYVVVFWQPPKPTTPVDLTPEPPLVAVPQLDSALLQKAKDATREDRLFLEAEPFSHLLAQALNVSEEAGRALGMPKTMVPVDDLRADPDAWRGRWLFYRGKVEDLTGPRPGHPVPGYGIYEATLKLASGERVLFAFSQPPGEGVHPGGWARAEGYVLKLRDIAYPQDLQRAPLLVGSQLREDYEDWQPVRELDGDKLSHILDVRREGDEIVTSNDSWRTLDVDQALALWHLGAYARDVAPKSFEEWRRVPALASQTIWQLFRTDSVERGTPFRVMGMLVGLRTVRARPNPAGIEEWTEAWVQVRDLGGKTIPIWVPRSVTQPLGASLEVRSYYYRRYAYESRDGQQHWVPLFVAADLEPFVFDAGTGMQQIGWIALGGMSLLVALALWGQRRERARVRGQEDALAARRRQRREKVAAPSP